MIHKHTQQILNENNEDWKSISTLFSNLRDKSYETKKIENKKNALLKLRLENLKRIVIGQIDINSIRNKFDCLTEFNKNEVDIIMISETKLVLSFPKTQFCMSRFSKPCKSIGITKEAAFYFT